MQPLLRITSVPINIEYSVQRAQLQHTSRPAAVQVTRQRGRATIQTTPAQVKIDSYEARASMGIKSAPRSVEEFASAGKRAGHDAVRSATQEGRYVVDSQGNGGSKTPFSDIAKAKVNSTTQTIMAFIPSVRPRMWVEGGDISFDYSKDELNFDWDVHLRPDLEYVPGRVEFAVTQHPRVIVEYLGGPHYVPPSADPDYVPPHMPPVLNTGA